jgi:hypothetical protein
MALVWETLWYYGEEIRLKSRRRAKPFPPRRERPAVVLSLRTSLLGRNLSLTDIHRTREWLDGFRSELHLRETEILRDTPFRGPDSIYL